MKLPKLPKLPSLKSLHLPSRITMERLLIVSAAALVVVLAVRGGQQTQTAMQQTDFTPDVSTQTIADASPDVEMTATVCWYEDGEGYLVPVTRQIPLQDRILHVRQKRENGPGGGQKRRQRGGDGLCGAGKRTGAGVVVADGQKQQQGPLQRLHLRGHVAGAQPQRQHRGRGGDQLLQHRVGRQKLPDRAAGRDKPLGTAAALRDHAVLHEQDRLGRAVKECMKLFG